MSIREVLNRAKKGKKKARAVETAKKVGTGLGVGAAIGSAIGVLFAPKSGKETRQDIADTAKSSVENIKVGANEASAKIAKVIEDGKERIAGIKKIHTVDEQVSVEEECSEECTDEECTDECEEVEEQ